MKGYPPERIAPLKRQRIASGPVVPKLAPAIDVDWLPDVSSKTISDVECD